MDHYIMVGSALMYNPHRLFDAMYYYDRARYYDGFMFQKHKRRLEGTTLWHYLRVGITAGIEPTPYFDSSYYIGKYRDIADAMRSGLVSCPLAHYFSQGICEERQPGPSFVPEIYLAHNANARDCVSAGSARGSLEAMLILEQQIL